VNAGGRLIIHDRSVANVTPNPFLLGSSGLGCVRLEASDIDVIHPANTLVTAGPLGIVDNLALDGGCSSEHGYLPSAYLPIGARSILCIGGNTNQIVSFSYPLGAGFVYYAAIPLDYYLDSVGCGSIGINGPAVYTPNVLTYMHLLNPLLHFVPPYPTLGGGTSLYLADMDGTPIASDRVANIAIYTSTNASLPLSSWTLLGNPTVLTGGLLRVDGITETGTAQFYRAVETP